MKQFGTILVVQQSKIFIDYKNLTYKILNTDRVLRWRSILKDYFPEIEYIQGRKIYWKTYYQDFPLLGIKRLHQIPLMKRKLCQKSMTSKNYLKVFFPIKLKLTNQYQRKDPRLMAKYETSC